MDTRPRARSPASRGSGGGGVRRSVELDEFGNMPNPYARFLEVADEFRSSGTAAVNGESYSVEVVTWTRLIETMFEKFAKGKGLYVDNQFHISDGSVNFVVSGPMTQQNVRQVIATKTRSWLPGGCEFRAGDAHEEEHDGTARIPDRQNRYFIKVTERAQFNLERRRKMAKKMTYCDTIVMFIAFFLAIYFTISMWNHLEGYRNPFGMLAEIASNKLPEYVFGDITG